MSTAVGDEAQCYNTITIIDSYSKMFHWNEASIVDSFWLCFCLYTISILYTTERILTLAEYIAKSASDLQVQILTEIIID